MGSMGGMGSTPMVETNPMGGGGMGEGMGMAPFGGSDFASPAPSVRAAPAPPRRPPPAARRAPPRAAPRRARAAPRPRAPARAARPLAPPPSPRARARARAPSDARPTARLQTYAKPMKKGGGMQLGKPKGGLGGGAGLLAAMANEGEIMADDPSLAPAAGGGAAATPGGRGGGGADAPITLTFDEKLVVTMNRDGGLEGMELKGDLQLLVTDATMAKATVPVRLGENAGFQFKTHPNIDKAVWSSSSVLGLKDPSRPFPTNSALGVLKWRMQTADEAYLPLTVSCWPTQNGDGLPVNAARPPSRRPPAAPAAAAARRRRAPSPTSDASAPPTRSTSSTSSRRTAGRCTTCRCSSPSPARRRRSPPPSARPPTTNGTACSRGPSASSTRRTPPGRSSSPPPPPARPTPSSRSRSGLAPAALCDIEVPEVLERASSRCRSPSSSTSPSSFTVD